MSHTVKANSLSVCTKGTPDGGSAKADPCKTPDGKVVVPENWAPCGNLGPGQTTTVFIKTQPVWNANGKLDPSLYPHAGTAGGTKSGTYLKQCEPTKYSADVIFEGGGVVRMDDSTLQNNQNCAGKVVPSSVGAASAEAAAKAIDEALALAKEAELAALEEDKAADGANQEGTKKEERDPKEGESPTEELCDITLARIEDAQGRGVEENGTLEIVPDDIDTISCTGELKGACPDEPSWRAEGVHSHQATGATTSFQAKGRSMSPMAWLAAVAPGTTNVTFTSQKNSRSFTVKTYPKDKLRIELEVPPEAHAIVNGLGKVINGVSGGKGVQFVGPNFQGFVQAQWKEIDGSPECFYAYTIGGGGTPLFGVKGDVRIPCPLAPLEAFLRFLGWFGVEAGFYLGVDIGKRLTISVTRDTPAPPHIEVSAEGRNRLEIKFKVEFGAKGTLKAEFGARSTLHVNVKGTLRGGNPAIEIQVVIDPLQGYIKLVWGKRNFQDIVEWFDTVRIPDPAAVIDLTKLFG